jgi:uncharacterized FAD-dependent dehydrogenase
MRPVHANVCIVGLGPAGLGAALHLAQSPLAGDTVCLEAGVQAPLRRCNVLQDGDCRSCRLCQVITGVGGASVLSGGKISSFPAGRALVTIVGNESKTICGLRKTLGLFREFVPLTLSRVSQDTICETIADYRRKGFEFRYYDVYHCHRADLVSGYTRMVDSITRSGVSVHLSTQVTRISQSGQLFHVHCRSGNKEITFASKYVVLATGRSGTAMLRSISPDLA